MDALVGSRVLCQLVRLTISTSYQKHYLDHVWTTSEERDTHHQCPQILPVLRRAVVFCHATRIQGSEACTLGPRRLDNCVIRGAYIHRTIHHLG